jgi:hypothetical protein
MPNWMVDHTGTVAIISLFTVGAIGYLLTNWSAHVRNDPQKAKLAATATFVSGFILTVLTSVVFTNLFPQKRDKDQRAWNLSQQHLIRLKPLLHQDADMYSEITKRITISAHITNSNDGAEPIDKQLDSLLAPDILSAHLQIHFPEYYQKKQSFQNTLRELDEEFDKTLESVKKAIIIPTISESRRSEVAQSVLERCLSKGPGMRLIVQGDSFNYISGGGTTGGNGHPSPDMVGAFQAFRSFHDSKIQSQCDDMNSRGKVIVADATKLKQEALTLAEITNLPNSCEYVKP